jgi:origin recognition complex subunit 1
MGKRKASTDGEVFLLPFECMPKYAVAGQIAPRDQDEDAGLRCFRSLEIEASVESSAQCRGKLGNGGHLLRRYVVDLREFVLLRPPSNESPPYVGRIVRLYCRMAESAKPRARVQWYYRPSDLLLEKPHRIYAEDEVLETPHFGDVEADTIVGRCTVTDYQQYAQLVSRPLNVFAKPLFDDASHAVDGADDDAKSTDSIFGDNYASASTRLFCRDYYDACADAVATSAFDDPDADPTAEIAEQGVGEESEESARIAVDEVPSSSDDSVDSDAEVDFEEGAVTGTRRRRQRRRMPVLASPPNRKGVRNEQHGAFQFCLPSDIGIGAELPCREQEKLQVRTFVETAIRESVDGRRGGDRCLYISGVPGTGKTATVREVMGSLQKLMEDGSLPGFTVVEVNGMSLPDPNLVYSELYAAVVGQRGVAPSRAAHLLERRFDSNSRSLTASFRPSSLTGAAGAREKGKCVILVLDEMDVLVSRKQQLLYDLLEWPTRPNSRLAVIGIANTMDLPERLLPRLKSRMGNSRLVYSPYTTNQIMEILDLRLKGSVMAFEQSAKRLVAAKVAAVSGDVRRAFDICRCATEIAEEEYAFLDASDSAADKRNDGESKRIRKPSRKSVAESPGRSSPKVVTVAHVNSAVARISGDSQSSVLRNLSIYERLLLVSVLNLARSMGTFDIDVSSSLAAVFAQCRSIVIDHHSLFPAGPPTTDELRACVARLSSQRVIIVERAAKPLFSRVIVNLSPEDCSFALMDDPIASAALHQKRNLRYAEANAASI